MSFDRVAVLAVNAVFASFGKDAFYIAPYDAGDRTPLPCRVIRDSQDRIGDFGDTRIVAQGEIIEIRMSEISSPMKGGFISMAVDGAFLVDADKFEIISKPKSEDPERLVWRCTVAA